MNTTVKLYSLTYYEAKTYLFALLFIAGNIMLPQLCHLAPGGGLTWLPIYFFTLVAAYKYGLRVGLLTALLSPVVNSMLFGMPEVAMLPVILAKSTLLAGASAYAAHKSGKISILALIGAVLSYQLTGAAVEWISVKDFSAVAEHLRIAIPGMSVQIFGGYFVLKVIAKF
jgi:thiamine transporter ThiT